MVRACGTVPEARWPGPGGPVPVAQSRPMSCPAVPVQADHLCSVASFSVSMDAQSLPGIWLFSKPLVRGKQYCEVGTIIRQKQEPNGCQSQLLDMKTLDVASLAAVFLERLCSRCCLPGVCFLEPFQNHPTSRPGSNDNKNNGAVWRRRAPN